MALSDSEKIVVELFQAAYGRDPSSSGLDYWESVFDSQVAGGLSADVVKKAIMNEMMNNAESAIRFPETGSLGDAVKQIFQNSLGREPATQAGIDFYVSRLEAGLTKSELVLEVLTDAKNDPTGDGAYLTGKVDTAETALRPGTDEVIFTLTSADDITTVGVDESTLNLF